MFDIDGSDLKPLDLSSPYRDEVLKFILWAE